jgi:hypothetical protein
LKYFDLPLETTSNTNQKAKEELYTPKSPSTPSHSKNYSANKENENRVPSQQTFNSSFIHSPALPPALQKARQQKKIALGLLPAIDEELTVVGNRTT